MSTDTREALAALVDKDLTFFDGYVDRHQISYGEVQQARAALATQPAAQPSAQGEAVAHPSHQTVRDWMPVNEALRLADVWSVGDLDNCGQWRAAIKVLADEVRALASAPAAPAQAVPLTTEQVQDLAKYAGLDWQRGYIVDDIHNRYEDFARAIEAHHGIKAAP